MPQCTVYTITTHKQLNQPTLRNRQYTSTNSFEDLTTHKILCLKIVLICKTFLLPFVITRDSYYVALNVNFYFLYVIIPYSMKSLTSNISVTQDIVNSKSFYINVKLAPQDVKKSKSKYSFQPDQYLTLLLFTIALFFTFYFFQDPFSQIILLNSLQLYHLYVFKIQIKIYN